jgi:hypothetical protein
VAAVEHDYRRENHDCRRHTGAWRAGVPAGLWVLEGLEGHSGSVVPLSGDGRSSTAIVSGLLFPTGTDPDGDLYISNVGFGSPPIGPGQILRVHLPDGDDGDGDDQGENDD